MLLEKPKMKKQAKITKMFRRGNKEPDDCEDLDEEIQQLEQTLREKCNELFQIRRNEYRHKQDASLTRHKEEIQVRPQKIVLSNSVENVNHALELMSMLTGVEVLSYVAGDHCCIIYHMQHATDKQIEHGLRIDMNTDGNVVTKSSLPVGFNFNAVMEDFDNILKPECLGAIRNALVAYYDRLQQYEALKKYLNVEIVMFKFLDGSHIEISFCAQSEAEQEVDEVLHVTLILEYRVYDIRPKLYSIKNIDLPDGVADTITQQCAIFKKKPLKKAFKEAFISGVGPYMLVQQHGVRQPAEPRRRKRFRPNKHNYNNDDTFLPEDCSDQGED